MSRSRKVLFVEPHGRRGRPFNAWIGRWPLLGPITLATLLQSRGYTAAVYNENVSGPIFENAAACADLCSADLVGISIMTPTAMRGYRIADRIRRDAPRVRVAFGGVHATFMPQEAIQHGDIVVRGEGENVIEAIARGELAGGIVASPPLEDLDSLPPLNHGLMWDFEKVVAAARRRELYELPVIMSRGCPHGCTFCSVTRMFGRRVRRQSVAKACGDLREYARRGFRRLFFYDDNFTANREWTRRLMERIGGLNLRFSAQARADFAWADNHRTRLDKPLLRAMRRAGGDFLYVGYETLDDSTAAEWGKGYGEDRPLRDRLREDTRVLHGGGFWIHGMFVLGPQHTHRDAANIVRFARENRIESLQVSILTPFPGTPLFRNMRPHLIFRHFPEDWDYYDGTHCLYDHSRMGLEDFQNTVLGLHRTYYRWGGWSLRRLRAVVADRLPLRDKAALLWARMRIARATLRQWGGETRQFLELATTRLADNGALRHHAQA